MMLIDDGRHRFVPVRLWLLAHGLLDFLGAASAGGANGVSVSDVMTCPHDLQILHGLARGVP